MEFVFHHDVKLHCVEFASDVPYTVTFIDADGSVQYGVARPPMEPCGSDGCSVIFAFHGSDVDAASPTWTGALPSQETAWILLPSNRDKYGYDWQGIGQWNALSCLEYFMSHLPGVPPPLQSSYAANRSSVVFSGHSMGGHGCLLFSVHFPDWLLGSLCAAAWIRFDHYVQEFSGSQSSHMDRTLSSILQSSVAEYHPDLLAVNMKGIPFMARMGSRDQNVCPWNLRRFSRILDEINGIPGFTTLSEVLGQEHWFDGVLSDHDVQEFLSRVLLQSSRPPLPETFEIRALNLWGEGRGGIRIMQFHTPFTLAQIQVEILSGVTWKLTTRNVRRFQMRPVVGVSFPSECIIDDQRLECVELRQGHFCQDRVRGAWTVCLGESWKKTERHPEASGPMRCVFSGPVTVVYGTRIAEQSERLQELSIRVANLLVARGHSLIHVMADTKALRANMESNLILIGGPEWNMYSSSLFFNQKTTLTRTCRFDEFKIHICEQTYSAAGIGAALLGTYETSDDDDRLLVLITGTDVKGLDNAVKLLPMAPNAEIPDYVIVSAEFLWKGSGSCLAAGYWGHAWECRPDISYPRESVTATAAADDLSSSLLSSLMLLSTQIT